MIFHDLELENSLNQVLLKIEKRSVTSRHAALSAVVVGLNSNDSE